MYMYLTCRFMV